MRDLGVGFGYLLQGQRWMARHGRSYGFGLLPGLVTLVLYAAALTSLALWGEDAVAWATPFADGWPGPWSGLFRGFLTAVLFALGLLLAVVTFTAVTLLVGQPFYENLSAKVDRDVSPDGTAPEPDLPLWHELWISARDGLRIVVRAAVWGVLLFALGFLPFVGQTAVPVIGFFVTGFFLTEELAGVALQRRGIDLRPRLALLRSRRTLVWGFGTPLGLAFLVPFVAVLLMPGAVAGATLLARDLLGEETTGGGRGTGTGHETVTPHGSGTVTGAGRPGPAGPSAPADGTGPAA
ncbi:EI24 domain-containing protein [Streptomyces tropicalis]|uniref:EI24 domain-containing protein n=1 Tax=Streptomyces tropicalis TaxID=3034234 RepID=A0ABT5ZY87_9ACTN|nr:EI24 domain-containing protein [Streptomyces tropicalis]MDF3297361.1 EI24 domain-containing protein [Streptomyces tropicalis]